MYKEITTVEEAFKRQKDQIDPGMLSDLSILPDKYSRGMMALLKLQVIIHAVNNDNPAEAEWKADYNNSSQYKWFPWYRGGDSSGSGFRFGDTFCGWSYTATHGGARLALKDEARAEHMNKYFQDLYKELYLVLE